MKTNKNFKDSVFSTLFGEPDLLRELYCAIGGISLSSDVPVSINTLKNALIMDLCNDISFEIGGKLVVLIEHQSTINPNMALRLLMYIAKVYERMIENRTVYSTKQLSIPWPEFYVLYNGVESYPDEKVLRLSELFEKPEDVGLSKKDYPLLELEVKVININEGRNKKIVNRCKKLAEYSTFMAKARAFRNELGSLEKAIKETIKYCHKHDILKEYLKIYGSEVLSMLYVEWDIEEAKKVWFEEVSLEIAKKLLAENSTYDFVQKITGLDMETIKKLNN